MAKKIVQKIILCCNAVMINGQEYRVNNLTFILTPEKIYIQTKYQCFYLEARTHYWKRRLFLIRTLVQLNEIRSLEELAGYCASGNIMWVSTNLRHNDVV